MVLVQLVLVLVAPVAALTIPALPVTQVAHHLATIVVQVVAMALIETINIQVDYLA